MSNEKPLLFTTLKAARAEVKIRTKQGKNIVLDKGSDDPNHDLWELVQYVSGEVRREKL